MAQAHPEWTLQAVQPADHAELIELYRTTFADYGLPGWSVPGLVAYGVVARVSGQLAGFGLSDWVGPHPRPGLAPLLDAAVSREQVTLQVEALPGVRPDDTVFAALAVAPVYRRRGLGRALVDDRVAEAWRHGSEQVFAHCVLGSGSAALYRALGFTELLRVARYYRTGWGMSLMYLSRVG